MITKHSYEKLVWVNIENPTRDDINQVMDEFNIHPLVAEELLQPTIRPRVDTYPNLLYLILHFPKKLYDPKTKENIAQETEIDFIIGQDFIITTHYEPMPTINDFQKKFETSILMQGDELDGHAGILFFYMMKLFYKNLQEDLEVLGLSLKEIEEDIFSRDGKNHVRRLAMLRRQFLDFKQSIRFHGDVLKSFTDEGKKFFGKDFSHHLAAITSEYWKVFSALEGHRETLGELRETHHLLLTTSANKIMKTVSVLAFIAVPITLITQVIGAGILDQFITDGDMLVTFVAATIVLSGGIFTYFKIKKWI